MPTGGVKVATVCGFPSGAHYPAVKAAEAADSVAKGQRGGHGDQPRRRRDKRLRRGRGRHPRGAGGLPRAVRVKVIIESAALTDEQIVGCCTAAESAGADFVKTSTGFHPYGGASVHAVELMAKTIGARLGVKASGGIRTAKDALATIEAGATRLGVSASAAILAELPDE